MQVYIDGVSIADYICSVGRKQLPREGSLSAALGETIRARLKGSQAGLATEIGVSLRTLERWLSGERPMPVDSLYAIAEVIGMSAADLVSEALRRRDSHGAPTLTQADVAPAAENREGIDEADYTA